MKKRMFIVWALLLIVVFPSLGEVLHSTGDWKQQLEEIKRNKMLKEKEYPQLVQYAYQGEVQSMDEAKRIKEKLLSYTDNYLPFFSKDSISMRLLNLNEIQKIEGNDAVTASVKSLSEYLDRVIQPGIHLVRLTWEFHSKTYESLCVVSDNRIVYDPIITNLMIMK